MDNSLLPYHRRRPKLGKHIGRALYPIWDWGTIPCTAKRRVGVGMEEEWIGVQSQTLSRLSREGMKIVGHEKA